MKISGSIFRKFWQSRSGSNFICIAPLWKKIYLPCQGRRENALFGRPPTILYCLFLVTYTSRLQQKTRNLKELKITASPSPLSTSCTLWLELLFETFQQNPRKIASWKGSKEASPSGTQELQECFPRREFSGHILVSFQRSCFEIFQQLSWFFWSRFFFAFRSKFEETWCTETSIKKKLMIWSLLLFSP